MQVDKEQENSDSCSAPSSEENDDSEREASRQEGSSLLANSGDEKSVLMDQELFKKKERVKKQYKTLVY